LVVAIVLTGACARVWPVTQIPATPRVPSAAPASVAPPHRTPPPPDLARPEGLRSPQLALQSIVGRPDIYQRFLSHMAFLPGGRLLTGGGDGSLRMWLFDEARLLRDQAPRPDEKGYSVHGWAVSPDGKLVAILMDPGNLGVLEVESGELVLQVTKRYGLQGIAFSGPRTLLVLEADPKTAEGQVRAIDAGTGQTIGTVAAADAVAFAPSWDGSRVAIAGRRWIRVVPGSLTGDPIWTEEGIQICEDDDSLPDAQVSWFLNHRCSPTLLWTGDGRRLVEVAGTVITVLDAANGRGVWQTGRTDLDKAILRASLSVDGKLAIGGESWACLLPAFGRVLEGSGERLLACNNLPEAWGQTFSPDGRLFVSARRGQLQVFDAETVEPVLVEGAHSGPIRLLAPGPDGKRLLSAGDDGSVRLWDEAREVRRWRLNTTTLAFAPEGDRFLVTHTRPREWPGDALFIDVTTGRDLLTIPSASRVALSPDGTALARIDAHGGLCLLDSRTGAQRWCQKAGAINAVGALAFLPGRRGVVVPDGKDRLRVWSFATGKPTRSFGESYTHVFLPVGDEPTSAVVEARGQRGGVMQSLAPGAALPPWKPSLPPPVAVSPDGRFLLAHAHDRTVGTIYVVRLRDGVIVDSLDACPWDDIFLSAAWSSDGARMYAGSWRGRIYEYDFDRAAAESAASFVPPHAEQLDTCHAHWEVGGFY
jgi:WD40 repeat protein